MPTLKGLEFLFDIDDKITAKIIKIQRRVEASAKKIDQAFARASKSQQFNASKVVASEKMRSVAVKECVGARQCLPI